MESKIGESIQLTKLSFGIHRNEQNLGEREIKKAKEKEILAVKLLLLNLTQWQFYKLTWLNLLVSAIVGGYEELDWNESQKLHFNNTRPEFTIYQVK